MKNSLVLFLVFLLATQTFSKWVLLLEFRLNRDYIAQRLCMNKSKPRLKCGGKCVLQKAMEKEEKSPSPAQSAKSNLQEILFSFEPASVNLSAAAAPPLRHVAHYNPGAYPSPLRRIFHPPV